jgi:hypothetical protein
MIPALNAPSHGPFAVPGGPLNADDYEVAVREGVFEGNIYVGKDLFSPRLP